MLKRLFGELLGGARRPAPVPTGASPDPGLAELLRRATEALDRGELEQAAAALRAGMAERPRAAVLPALLAEVLQRQGRDREALDVYRRTLELDPNQAESRFNYAAALARLGEADAARREYARICDERPEWAPPRVNLGLLELGAGNVGGAVALLRAAIAADPDMIEARINLALALKEAGQLEASARECEAALAARPGNTAALKNLVATRLQLGDVERARAGLGRLAALAPSDGSSITHALALPAILDSNDEIARVRRELDAELDRLSSRALVVPDPLNDVGVTPFYLAYHGLDNRALHEKIAALHLRACPSLAYAAPQCTPAHRHAGDDRLRVGFVSRHLHDHSIGNVTRGLVAMLDKTRFSARIFAFRPPFDANSRDMASHADEWVVLGNDLARAREAIARHELDILFYPDIGMDPYTYFLAFARLAPAQCTTWGHPVTTGVPTMDYYLSTDYFEPENGAAHYSERLERLRDVAFPGYYYRPALPAPAARAALGFDDDAHVYFCPQALFKFHPEFDAILERILRADARARIYLVANRDDFRRARLEARLARTLGALMDRLVFLPRAERREGYLQRLQACDVVLDTIHYCGGNTSLEAISAGALVVTLPGATMRSRHTYGFYRKMRFTETVVATPEAYVERAVEIATDAALRARLRSEQAERAGTLYEDRAAVAQIEAFFERAIAGR
jgi:predicted O-linked N-acetylglucosamine transferase (SPINDLY family)